MSYQDERPFSTLLGKTLTSIKGCTVGSSDVYLETSDGKRYRMYHEQDCCESVGLEEIVGDIDDLLNNPLLIAEEACKTATEECYNEYGTGTWTFYKLATIKGYVTLRWLGTSNGYYSEAVNFEELPACLG